MDENSAIRRGLGPACLALLLVTMSTASAMAADGDGDGVDDAIDNCTRVSNRDQRDSDADGIGNGCDADLDQDGKVTELDFSLIRRSFGVSNPVADLDGDSRVSISDLTLAQRSNVPGPSEVALPLRADFARRPPIPDQVDLFARADRTTDGIVQVTFSERERQARAIRSTLIFAPDGNGRVLNDLGIAPDLVAGDGVFSGTTLLATSPAATRERLRRIASSLNGRNTILESTFNGRELTGRKVVRPDGGFQVLEPLQGRPGFVGFPKFGLPSPLRSLPPLCDEERCLMIRDLTVTADPTRTFDPCDTDGDGNLGTPDGPWTFKTLMTNLANEGVTGIPATQYVHHWLKHWLSNSVVNGQVIPARAGGVRSVILNQLPSWDPDDPESLQEEDLARLPFRLLAIVNRNDLAGSGYGGVARGESSEIRFVFGLLQKIGTMCRPHPNGMSVIFEYKDSNVCNTVAERASAWVQLDTAHPPYPSASYNAALQTITDGVTNANARPAGPAGSALGQLRTNDIAMGVPWEMREFQIDPATLRLEPHTLAQTPASSFHMTSVLRDCIDDAACRTAVPITFGGTNFLAASVAYNHTFHFDAAGVTSQLNRRDFSLNTCGGCHAANALDPAVTFGPAGLNRVPPYSPFFTATPESFYHVDARTPGGLRATLSRFLQGTDDLAPLTPIPDRVTVSPAQPPRRFDDLERRNRVLAAQSLGCSAGFGTIVEIPAIAARPVVNRFLFEQIAIPNAH